MSSGGLCLFCSSRFVFGGFERSWTIQMHPHTERLETVVIRGLGASRERSEWGGVYVSKYALRDRHMGSGSFF